LIVVPLLAPLLVHKLIDLSGHDSLFPFPRLVLFSLRAILAPGFFFGGSASFLDRLAFPFSGYYALPLHLYKGGSPSCAPSFGNSRSSGKMVPLQRSPAGLGYSSPLRHWSFLVGPFSLFFSALSSIRRSRFHWSCLLCKLAVFAAKLPSPFLLAFLGFV